MSARPGRKPPRQIVTDSDGLPALEVGRWAIEEKHPRLRKFVGISAFVRRRFESAGGCAYIDPFCSPGRAWLKESNTFHPSSSLVAWEESKRGVAPFRYVRVADLNERFVAACTQRLKSGGAPVHGYVGKAESTIQRMVDSLPKHSFHLAFLDPFSLGALPFSVIECLASSLERVDLIVHFSLMDLRRFMEKDMAGERESLNVFAPGWREVIEALPPGRLENIRAAVVNHWCGLIRGLGFHVYERSFETIKGDVGQELYWLVFASRHDRGHEFWDKIRHLHPQSGELFDT